MLDSTVNLPFCVFPHVHLALRTTVGKCLVGINERHKPITENTQESPLKHVPVNGDVTPPQRPARALPFLYYTTTNIDVVVVVCIFLVRKCGPSFSRHGTRSPIYTQDQLTTYIYVNDNLWWPARLPLVMCAASSRPIGFCWLCINNQRSSHFQLCLPSASFFVFSLFLPFSCFYFILFFKEKRRIVCACSRNWKWQSQQFAHY